MTNANATVAVLTVSDRVSRGEAVDKSGPAIAQWITAHAQRLFGAHANVAVRHALVADEQEEIRRTAERLISEPHVRLLLSTGGTGFGVRDRTPEALSPLIERHAPGFVHAMFRLSLEKTKFAVLSRPVAGVTAGGVIVVTLPGSPRACLENLEALVDVLPHALDLSGGGSGEAVHQRMAKNEHGLVVANDGKVLPTHAATLPAHAATLPVHAATSAHTCTHHTDAKTHHHTGIPDTLGLPPSMRSRHSPFPMVSMAEAMRHISEQSLAVLHDPRFIGTTSMPVTNALIGRRLGDEVKAPMDVPDVDVSIMDGYAVRATDCPGDLRVVGSVAAGDAITSDNGLEAFHAIRITTGAPIPQGASAVVKVEDTELLAQESSSTSSAKETLIRTLVSVGIGENIRPAGSDVKKGQQLLPRTTHISAEQSHVGLLLSAGVQEVTVQCGPTIGVLSTGNEVVDCGALSATHPGMVVDANRPSLMGLLDKLASKDNIVDLGIVRDDPGKLLDTLQNAFTTTDIVITTGGVSMGEHDHIKGALKELGFTIHFGRVRMKPGKPCTFATRTLDGRRTYFFGLPGNPVSASVCFMLFVVPLLRRCAGISMDYRRVTVKLAHKLKLDWERPEYQRASVRASVQASSVDGTEATATFVWLATGTGGQCSSRIGSFAEANALLELPAGKDIGLRELAAGTTVQAIFFRDIFE